MRKTILAVLMTVVIATPFIAWAADTSCTLTWVWEYSCNDPIEEDFLFKSMLNGHIGFSQGNAYRVVWSEENCSNIYNSSSDVSFQCDDFMPVVYFGIENYYAQPLYAAQWWYFYRGIVLPRLNVGFLMIWMDASNALQFDETLYCSMKKIPTPMSLDCCYLVYPGRG